MFRFRRTLASCCLAAVLSLTVSADAFAAITVPNQFSRTCSRFTGRCTPYYQTNGPYNSSVGSVYYTNWCWCWIW